MRKQAVLLLALLIEACVSNQPPVVVSPALIRERLGDRVAIMRDQSGALQLYFRRNGVATVTGETSEFIHWWVDPERGLCMRWYDGTEICAPLLEGNTGHYQWAGRTINVLDIEPLRMTH